VGSYGKGSIVDFLERQWSRRDRKMLVGKAQQAQQMLLAKVRRRELSR